MKLKFDSGFRVISEYLSQYDSRYRVKLTLNIKSNWLSLSSQIDSHYRVKLTLNIESNWLSLSSQIDSNILQLLRIPGSNFSFASDSIIQVKMTQIFFRLYSTVAYTPRSASRTAARSGQGTSSILARRSSGARTIAENFWAVLFFDE